MIYVILSLLRTTILWRNNHLILGYRVTIATIARVYSTIYCICYVNRKSSPVKYERF